MKSRISFFFIIISFLGKSQNDSLPYEIYRNKVVVYADLGYSSAPFSINYKFNQNIDQLKFKNNFKTNLGLGIQYKWFAFRLSFPVIGDVRPISRYGKTINVNFGVEFTLKKTFCDIDFLSNKGYSIKNAYKWNDTLNSLHPNDIRPSIQLFNFSTNVWYFHNKDYKIPAVKGRTGHYNREVKTWYLKNTFNVFGIGNDLNSIVPDQLVDSTVNKTDANVISSLDIGIVPGYAYVNRINNWQFSFLAGIGGVLQAKFYNSNNVTRGYLGLAPRFDFRFIGGYSVPRYFVFLVTDFDNKSIRFTDFVYRQNSYSVRIVAGLRLNSKEERKEKKLLKND